MAISNRLLRSLLSLSCASRDRAHPFWWIVLRLQRLPASTTIPPRIGGTICGPILTNRTVVLVTHHVELVLLATAYLVRMLDGHIDAQGTSTDLRAQGLLEQITHSENVHAAQQQETGRGEESKELEVKEGLKGDVAATKGKRLSSRKLVKDEHRDEGSVKRSVYNTCLKAT